MKMEADGHITLPPPNHTHSTRLKPITHTARTDQGEEIALAAGKLPDVHIHIAKTAEEKSLWNEDIDRYHYPGYAPLPGAQSRYFVYSGADPIVLVGFSACAWRVAPRDRYIGWSEEKRQPNWHLGVLNEPCFEDPVDDNKADR